MTPRSQSVHENRLSLAGFWERAPLKGDDDGGFFFAAFDLKESDILTKFAGGGGGINPSKDDPLESQLSTKLFLVELTLGQS